MVSKDKGSIADRITQRSTTAISIVLHLKWSFPCLGCTMCHHYGSFHKLLCLYEIPQPREIFLFLLCRPKDVMDQISFWSFSYRVIMCTDFLKTPRSPGIKKHYLSSFSVGLFLYRTLLPNSNQQPNALCSKNGKVILGIVDLKRILVTIKICLRSNKKRNTFWDTTI